MQFSGRLWTRFLSVTNWAEAFSGAQQRVADMTVPSILV